MQGHYPLSFEREMGCTAAQLRAWLPAACGGRDLVWHDHGVDVALEPGCVSIAWRACEPRRIALIVLPRLQVRFEASGVDGRAWQRFMRFFDLSTLRGGG